LQFVASSNQTTVFFFENSKKKKQRNVSMKFPKRKKERKKERTHISSKGWDQTEKTKFIILGSSSSTGLESQCQQNLTLE
jgi:hypothetical protein